MTDDNNVKALLAEGFTKRFAQKYLTSLNSEEEVFFDLSFFKWSHDRGFCASDASIIGLNSENLKNYLSDYDYYRMWPNDSWLRFWHNDKLSLKYILNGTSYAKYLPEYYFYYLPKDNGNGYGLRRLIDCPAMGQSFRDFFECLKIKKDFACKPNNGGRCVGFHRIQYKNGELFLDGEKVCEDDIVEFVETHPNYIYTQFIKAGGGLEVIHPLIHTIRILVLNKDGVSPSLIGGYIRFPTDYSGVTNYVHKSDNNYSYVCKLDVSNGVFGDGKKIYINRTEDLPTHPQTGTLVCGKLPYWEVMAEDTKGMSKLFFGSEILGFDFGITPDGPKLMEINTFPGIQMVQVFYPLMLNNKFSKYVNKKIKYLNNLSDEERKKRNNIE